MIDCADCDNRPEPGTTYDDTPCATCPTSNPHIVDGYIASTHAASADDVPEISSPARLFGHRIGQEHMRSIAAFLRVWAGLTKQQRAIVQTKIDRPTWGAGEIARVCDCSRQYVHRTLALFTP